MKYLNQRRLMDRRILECLRAKKGVEKTAFELGVSKRRVRDVRLKAGTAGYLSGLVPIPVYPLALFPDEIDRRSFKSSTPDQALLLQKEWIEENLRIGWKPISVYEELKIPGISRSSFYRFLERHKLDDLAAEVQEENYTPPIRHEPGEALQLDWGKMRDVIDPITKKKKTLWAFVGVLGFSRYMMIHLVWTNDVPTTLAAIGAMFSEIGGVPAKVTSDNPKCFSLIANMYDPLLNPAFIRFSNHYDFTIECLPPRDPKKKGKVERLMPFARRLFETYPKDWISIEHGQTYLNSKVSKANQRIHGTTRLKPLIVFLEKESQALEVLPSLAYEPEDVAYPKVRRDGFVRYMNKYYAVGEGYTRKETTVLATQRNVTIYCDGRLLEVYARIQSPYETHATKDHLKKPWEKVEENNAFYLERAKKIGPHVCEFIRKVLARGQGFVDNRIIWGILSLDKKYEATQINQCAEEAMAMGSLSSRLVERLIKLKPKPQSVEEKSRERSPSQLNLKRDLQPKFARPMSTYAAHAKIKTVH